MDLLHAYVADFAKSEKTEDGLVVTGIATSPTLDKDQQICDPKWLQAAMPKWAEIGNVREMHGKIAAGVGLETTSAGDDWHVKSLCVDPITALKIEKGVLKGYSIGIKNGRVVKDKAAPGGRIVGGDIVEVSYVDRPCNPDSMIGIAKVESGATEMVDAEQDKAATLFENDDVALIDLTKALGLTVEDAATTEMTDKVGLFIKRQFTDEQRKALAKEGKAMPGGGFPIENVEDLKNAIHAIGRAKNPAAAKAHIKSRAKALGQSKLIPSDWKALVADIEKADAETWTHDPTEVRQLFCDACDLLKAEIDEWMKGENEVYDVQDLLTVCSIISRWWKSEASEGELPYPFTGGSDMDSPTLISLGVDADLVKRATAKDATDETKTELRTEVAKALGFDADTIKTTITDTAKAAAIEATKGFAERLETVEQMAAPGGPVKSRTEAEAATASKADQLRSQAEYFRQTAATVTDPEMARSYRTKAVEADSEARALEATAA